jgi:tRNA(Ile2) C34 agmatinyltransferase TiaS
MPLYRRCPHCGVQIKRDGKRCPICCKLVPLRKKVLTREQKELLDKALFVMQNGTAHEMIAMKQVIDALYLKVVEGRPVLDGQAELIEVKELRAGEEF